MKKITQISCLILLLMFPFCKLRGQVDVITAERLNLKMSTYDHFKDVQLSSTVKYIGYAARDGDCIRFREKPESKSPYCVIATSFSNQYVKSIKIDWGMLGQKTVSIYGMQRHFADKDFYEVKPIWGTHLMKITAGDTMTYALPSNQYKYICIFANEGGTLIKAIHLEWERISRNIKFEKSLYEVAWGNDFTAPVLAADGARYSSSDTGVATVNPETGKVTLVGCGMTTITASFSESGLYKAEEVSYTLIVNPTSSYAGHFDFSDLSLWLPGHPAEQPLPNVIYLHSKDVEVKITAGEKSPSMGVYKDKKGILLSRGSLVEISVPAGFNLYETACSYSYYSSGNKKRMEKTSTLTKVTYRVLDEVGVLVTSLNLKYAGTYKLKIGKAGHVTFAGACAYVLPEGLRGGVVSVDEQQKTVGVDYCVEPGDVVAAGEPLILKGDPGEYTLLPTEEAGFSYGGTDHKLHAALTNEVILAPVSSRLYILAMKNETLGFYWQRGSQEGDAVRDISHKAYLEMPVSREGAVQGYRLSLEESTGLEEVDAPVSESAEIYTLTGIRVNRSEGVLPRGIYIMRGKKIYVK